MQITTILAILLHQSSNNLVVIQFYNGSITSFVLSNSLKGSLVALNRIRKSIYEYTSGRPAVRTALYINYRNIEGNPIKEKVDTLDPKEAQALLAKKKLEVERAKKKLGIDKAKLQRAVSHKKMTLYNMSEFYYEKRKTIDNDKDKRNYHKRVEPTLGKKIASKITVDDIEELRDLLEKSYAPKTVNEQINALKAMYNESIRRGWVNHNPCLGVKKLENIQEPGRVLSQSELDLMFETFKNGNIKLELHPHPTLFLFTTLLYHTGARPAAILDLQFQHIDFENGRVKIKAMKKGSTYYRKVKQEVMEQLKEWLNKYQLKYNDYIFYSQQSYYRAGNDTNVKKQPMSRASIQKPVQKYFDKLFNKDIPTTALMDRVVMYSLRRTAGTRYYKAKGIAHAMAFLNHTNIKTTQIYLNITDDMEADNDIL